MRRVIGGLVPLTMAGAALFVAAPGASAATPAAAIHQAAPSCPPAPYGPGSASPMSVTVTYNSNGTITLHISASCFKPGEQVNISVTVPSRNVGAFIADSTGSIAGSIVLPAGYKTGSHSISGLGAQSGAVASASFTLTSTSGNIKPCTVSESNVQSSGIVLAAAYLSASCKSASPAAAAALPGTAGGPPASGGSINGVGTASSASSASQLPFTGFNAGTVAASGAILVGAGGALVLVSRRRRRNAWQ